MRRLLLASAAAALISAAPASATIFTFSVVSVDQIGGSASYVPNYQFSINDATASFIDGGFYTEVDGVATAGQRPALGSPGGDENYNANYKFYTGNAADYGGGFDDGGSNSYFSDQLFAGTTANPTFLTGTYSLYNDPNNIATATLTVTSDATSEAPESGQWMMMIAGFGLIGTAMRRGRMAQAVA